MIISPKEVRELDSELLYIRDSGMIWDDDTSGSWAWGRWILFVIFVVAVIALFFCTARVNKRRRIMGQAPIRGTNWMMPPSYRQSEQSYNGSSGRQVDEYVPKYTATANEEDLGYYDARGVFHANDKAEYLPPPPLVQELGSESALGLERPPPAVVRDNTSATGDIDFDTEFRRYTHLNTNPTGLTANTVDITHTTEAGSSSSIHDGDNIASSSGSNANSNTVEEELDSKNIEYIHERRIDSK